MNIRNFLLTSLACLNFGAIWSCGWDYDTIAMEKQQFPSVHELITGKFLRHSPELYYWRVKDRSEDIKLWPDSLELYDDLAWAYDKVGEHDKAVEVMKEKDQIEPGLYETYANMGTSYLHGGDLEEGLNYIKKAIEINPDAHFGREIYQQKLVEYILEKGERDSTGALELPLGSKNNNFYHYLGEQDVAKAVKGIAGMMRFGNYDSPVLLEVLGDLLSNADVGTYKGAGHLASRAYLKASFETKGQASKQYRTLAAQHTERFFAHRLIREEGSPESERMNELAHHYMPVDKLEKVLKAEISAAHEWYDSIRSNEIKWINQGIDPDSAFSANYYDEPEIEAEGQNPYAVNPPTIDEQRWLAMQTHRPEGIKGIYSGTSLDDSTKAALDSIYNEEFSHYTPPKPKGDTPPLPGQQTEEDSYTGGFMAIMGAIVFVILFIVGRYLLRSKNRS